LSGIAAAKAILSGEETSAVGSAYLRELEGISMMSAMKAVERLDDLLNIPRLYKTYPRLITDLLSRLYWIDQPEAVSIVKAVRRALKDNELTALQLMKDGFRGYRSL
jgi:hypothetical protein